MSNGCGLTSVVCTVAPQAQAQSRVGGPASSSAAAASSSVDGESKSGPVDPLEGGTKMRKSYKRYKDYEVDGGGPDGDGDGDESKDTGPHKKKA
jgi:hypothetical protein